MLKRVFAGVIAIAGILPLHTAEARPSHITWPTWLRAGPSQHYAVISELTRNQAVDVGACEGEWCRGRGR